MKKRIIISSNNPLFNFAHKNSAIALFLSSISELLSEKYDVEIYPNEKRLDSNSMVLKKSWFKKIAKRTFSLFYTLFKEYRYLKNQKEFINKFWKTKYDQEMLIEFLSYGQSLSTHSNNTNTKIIIIYDCPLHTQYQEMNLNKSFILDKIIAEEKKAVLEADGLIVYSESVLNSLKEQGLIENQEVLVQPAIAFDSLLSGDEKNRNHSEINIGFIGSFLVWHKVSLLVKVFEELADKLDNINLYLVGYGIEWAKIKKQVEVSRFFNRIHLTGYVTDDELRIIKRKLDIGVMPGSNWYGSPLKIFEYGALGIPVIAPNEPTIIDCFQKDHEILIIDKKDEHNSLRKLIYTLSVDEEQRKLMGKRIKKRMNQDYNKIKYKEKLFNLIDKVL